VRQAPWDGGDSYRRDSPPRRRDNTMEHQVDCSNNNRAGLGSNNGQRRLGSQPAQSMPAA